MEKMIRFSNGSIHDINHLIAVWTYAKTIGELERLDPETQFILEVAAITHDIACPVIRDEAGHTDHKLQETMGAPMVREFLADTGMAKSRSSGFPILSVITTRSTRLTVWIIRS